MTTLKIGTFVIRGNMHIQHCQKRRTAMTAQIIERHLGDGSAVFDVCFGALVLAAVTERDAIALADKIQEAIEAHTNETIAWR